MLEGHGRENIDKDINIDRTVGWFTNYYPVQLSWDQDVVISILKNKNKLRTVSLNGIGYSILGYPATKNIASFNYLGEVENEPIEGNFKYSDIDTGKDIHEENNTSNLISLNCYIKDKKLYFIFDYNEKKYKDSQMKNFQKSFIGYLQEIVKRQNDFDINTKVSSDFSTDISERDFNYIWNIYENNIDKILPLMPIQKEFLSRISTKQKPSLYTLQTDFSYNDKILKINFDISSFIKAINILVNKYDIFRSTFIYRDISEPFNIILKNKEPEINIHHVDTFDDFKKIQKNDIQRGFNLENDTLIRVNIVFINEKDIHILITICHMIFDGWSNNIFNKELKEVYLSLINNSPIHQSYGISYSNLTSWLQSCDRKKAHNYWSKFTKNIVIPKEIPCSNPNACYLDSTPVSYYSYLTKNQTEQLKQISVKYNVTVNSIMETLILLLISKHTNKSNICVGKIVSGRNAQIPEVEKYLGAFINLICLQNNFNKNDTFIENVKKIQKQSLNSSKYDFVDLTQIRKNNVKIADIIQHLIIFKNFMQQENDYEEQDLLIANSGREEFHYKLSFFITQKDVIEINFRYLDLFYSKDYIKKLAQELNQIINQIISQSPRVLIKQL